PHLAHPGRLAIASLAGPCAIWPLVPAISDRAHHREAAVHRPRLGEDPPDRGEPGLRVHHDRRPALGRRHEGPRGRALLLPRAERAGLLRRLSMEDDLAHRARLLLPAPGDSSPPATGIRPGGALRSPDGGNLVVVDPQPRSPPVPPGGLAVVPVR